MPCRVGIYFRGGKVGTADLIGGRVSVSGDRAAAALVDHYRSEEVEGEALLDVLLTRLRGQWWCADESVDVTVFGHEVPRG